MADTVLHDVWCVIPVYNNASTVRSVAAGCRERMENVLVVDDGSTDADIAQFFGNNGVTVLRHERNKGKGAALKTALNYINARNGRFMLTIDADGQHLPADIPLFLKELDEEAVVVGARDFTVENVPGKSKFGRAFSNFWLRAETGVSLSDTQSGFRMYPVRHLARLAFASDHYDFEAEVLARAAWAGLRIKSIAVQTYYPPQLERVTSFRPFKDNWRLTLLHARLIGRRLLPLPHAQLVKKDTGVELKEFLRHPMRLLRELLREHATPAGLAAAAFVGVFFAVLPLVSVHTLVILYITARLHLNKVMALMIQHICMPPLVPIICIELGHYFLYGKFLTDITWQTVFGQIPTRLWEWFVGSLIVAPVLASAVSIAIFFIARKARGKKNVLEEASCETGRLIKVKKRGNALGIWFFKTTVRFFGLRPAYVLLSGVALHYALFDAHARRGALAYVRRRFPGSSWLKEFFLFYRLFFSQGMQLIDRYAAVSGAVPFDLRLENPEALQDLCRGEKGFILLVSHMGNWQIAMTALSGIQRTVYLVMRPEDNQAVKASLKIDAKNERVKVISPEQYLGGVVEAMNAIASGGVVAVMGDRPYSFESIPVPFLGSDARLPYSAFTFAAASGCPVAVFSAPRAGFRRYTVRIDRVFTPAFDRSRDKKQQLRQWLGEYVTLLEEFVREYPFQCFLFHDIWHASVQAKDEVNA